MLQLININYEKNKRRYVILINGKKLNGRLHAFIPVAFVA